jgi:hypothetical protein
MMPYVCELCGRSFPTKHGLDVHKWIKHDPSSPSPPQDPPERGEVILSPGVRLVKSHPFYRIDMRGFDPLRGRSVIIVKLAFRRDLGIPEDRLGELAKDLESLIKRYGGLRYAR